MNFQERFKGKTSTISKDGIEGVVLSSLNPVKKQMSVSYSNAQLPRVVSSTSLDNSPKRPSKTPLSSTHVVANSIALADLPTPTSFTPNRNPGHRYRLSEGQFDSMNPFLPQSRQSLTPSREGQNYTRQLAPLKQRDRMLARRSLNGIATKSANQSQLFSEPLPSDQSGMSFNPNNFYNQHSQVRASGRTASEIHSNPRVELKANRNHLHKKSFENLSQQIKQKHISQEVFKSLVRPEYPQYMSNQHQDESPVNSSQKTWRLYDSLQQQKRHERSLSYNSNHFADHNQHHIGQESHTIREINKGDMHIQGDDRSSRNEQGVILSRIRQRTPSSVNGAMHGRKVYFKNNEEWSERRDVVTFSQLQESGRPSHINLGNLYQPKSPERPKKTTWGEPLEANFK